MSMIHCKECGAEVSKSANVCPKCGKRLKHTKLRVIIGVILLLIGLGILFSADTTTNTSNNSSSNNQVVQAKEKFTLVSSEMNNDSLGGCYIEGTIQNNTNKTYSYAQVTFNIYDKDGNQLGTAVDNINNFQANGTWKYKAYGFTTEKVARCEFVEITGW